MLVNDAIIMELIRDCIEGHGDAVSFSQINDWIDDALNRDHSTGNTASNNQAIWRLIGRKKIELTSNYRIRMLISHQNQYL